MDRALRFDVRNNHEARPGLMIAALARTSAWMHNVWREDR
jgi:hypothetical protein